MNLYRISQDINNDYNTYDSAIVCAENEDEARFMHPGGCDWDGICSIYKEWCNAEDVNVEFIGVAKQGLEKGSIVASYNAG